ncbi:related to Phosphatidylglycerol/phosphatidylinositol transfer protein [Hanseniaspora guilliermondii]|uniref:Phosphatidylglycerol/phosphatidylinositol transfer protein n=1 Tax=Hanseniaspora guilliermondii TaxID=56406 RepID=A0A1L0FFH8_9ASCO|nr:related to Phosphatidylglycerol/phosphatidylinositol transfer protein [Hanseniaspora guilliermondii]
MKPFYLIIVSLFTCVFGTSIFSLDVPDGSPISGNTPLEQCELSENHILDIQSLIMEPQPPRIGENLVMSATGLISDTIQEGAYIEVTVKLGLIQILKKNFDLCELLYENKDDLGLECPVSPGTYKLLKEVEIPPQAPAGKYIVLVRAFNGDEQKIGCVTGEITLGH